MKLDGLFENEFEKLKKVRLKTDPKKPLLEYEGFILKEDRKFLQMHEGLMQSIRSGLKKIGSGYEKLERGAAKVKQFGTGDIGVLQDIGSGELTYSEQQLKGMGVPINQINRLKNKMLPYVTLTSATGDTYTVSFKNNRFVLKKI